jgi:hypothetical protein
MRRAFPYVATLLAVAVLAAVFVFRPTPFIGVSPGAMESSLAKKLAGSAAVTCEKDGENEWSCAAEGAGPSLSRDFAITVNGFGCWTATPTGKAEVGTPTTVTGCITVFDQ